MSTFLSTGDWTPATLLGEFLWRAEQKYGRRDMNWTVVGVESRNEPQPCIWSPGPPAENRRHVCVKITLAGLKDLAVAAREVAHEAVHLLSPIFDPGKAPVIEEGLATLFAHEEVAAFCPPWAWRAPDPKYLSAEDDVKQLLAINQNAIADLRANHQNRFLLMKPGMVEQVAPGIDNTLAARLCQPF